MAKSLRSKWKRKMKAEKRVRYGEKERVRLLNMLDEAKVAEQEPIVRLRRVFKTTEKKEDETGWILFLSLIIHSLLCYTERY